MDTRWIELPTGHPDYIVGCMKFIEFAKEAVVEGKIRCPCTNCKVDKWLPVNELERHILFKGFFKSYTNWFFHGNGDLLRRKFGIDEGSTSVESIDNQTTFVGRDDMGRLLRLTFGVDLTSNDLSDAQENDEGFEEPIAYEEPMDVHFSKEEEAKYKKLLEASDKELHEGCTTFSKLSFLLHLFHLCMNHWSAESFNMLLKLLIYAFPQIIEFPVAY